MKVLLQRVSKASVKVDDQIVGEIDQGLLLYVGFKQGDQESVIAPHIDKVLNLRIFPDDAGKMNLSVQDVKQDLLVVSQFTLYGDTQKGRRPSFVNALDPDIAKTYYEKFIAGCKEKYPHGRVEEGEFGANMIVSAENLGPINFIIELG